MGKRILLWLPAATMMALIFVASGTPGEELPKFGMVDLVVKKGGHMLGYAMLATACYFAAYFDNRRNRTRATVLALCLAIAYAALDEFHQRFTPGRSPSVVDVGIDSCGALVGVAILNLVARRCARSGEGRTAS